MQMENSSLHGVHLSAEDRMPSPITSVVEAGDDEAADAPALEMVQNAIGCGNEAQVQEAIAAYRRAGPKEQEQMKGPMSTLKQYREQNWPGTGSQAAPLEDNPHFQGNLAPQGGLFMRAEFDRDANSEMTDDDDSSDDELGEWEDAERQVIDDEEHQHETGNRAGQWISDGARPASLPWAREAAVESPQATVPGRGVQPVHVVGRAAEEPAGPAQCNEKCINTEAGAMWNTFESSRTTQASVGLLTVLALFADDLRVLLIQKEADEGWSVLTMLVMIVFAVEWACNSVFQRNYFLSLFFFLDLIATLSLIPDIHWIGDDFYGVGEHYHTAATVCEPLWPSGTTVDGDVAMELNDQDGTAAEISAMARTGRSARIGARATRIVRIVRLCRVLRVFRMMRFMQSANDEENEEDEMRANPTVIGKRVSAKASQRVVLIVLGVFVATTLSHTMTAVDTDLSPMVGLAFLQTSVEWAGQVGNHANVTLQAFAEDFMALTHDVVCLKNFEDREHPISFEYDTERLVELRNQELALYWSEDGNTLAVIDVRQIKVDGAWANIWCIVMILVILVVTSAVLTWDSDAIVVKPISRIIESVKKMEKTLSYLTDADGEKLEMQRIAGAMDKMALLLKIGFGDAGNAIISKNLVGGKRLDVMLPGRHVTAIFGFCDIRKFTDTTEVLRAQVMPFVNFCASIVHGTAKRYGGNPNKNVGDAFLIVWKTETFDKIDPMTAAIEARDDPTINLAPSTSGAMAPRLERTSSQEAELAREHERRREQKRRRLSLGPKQMNEILATQDVQDMLKKSVEEQLRKNSTHTPVPELEQAQPEPERKQVPVAKPGQPKKQPAPRKKRRARKQQSDTTKTDESSETALEPASPAVVLDDTETPRYRKTYDAPERETPRTPATPKLAEFVVDMSKAGIVPPPASSELARDDSIGESQDDSADNALMCFLEVIAQIAEKRTEIILRRKLPRLFMAYPNYKLALGFGLHHGWAIEGSLGSNHKVDASYLSPHVTLSDTLEAATKQYGIPILMSGQFVKLLSKEWWERCRMVDRVQLAGAGDSRRRIYDLWTCDHHNQAIVGDRRYKNFLTSFRTAVLLYVQGNWGECRDKLEECLHLKEKDGPAKKLMAILRTHDFQKPKDWKGFRILE